MTDIPNTVRIAILELQEIARQHDNYEQRVDAVMDAARRHWLVVDEQEQFKAACGALMTTGTDEQKADVESQLRSLAAISALVSGIPVDLEAMGGQPTPIVALMPRWRQLRAEAGGQP